jgi:hypothetical protein
VVTGQIPRSPRGSATNRPTSSEAQTLYRKPTAILPDQMEVSQTRGRRDRALTSERVFVGQQLPRLPPAERFSRISKFHLEPEGLMLTASYISFNESVSRRPDPFQCFDSRHCRSDRT